MESAHLSPMLLGMLSLLGVVTLCWVGLLVYRAVVGHNEETDLILDKAEARLAKEQHDLGVQVEKLDKPIMMLGISVGVLGVLTIGLWLWEGFNRSN